MNDDPNARPSLSERYGVAVSSGTSLDHMILAARDAKRSAGAAIRGLVNTLENDA